MGFWDRVSAQLSHPSGLGGRLTAAVMNRGNAWVTAAGLERLEIGPQTRVLEIGFGGGASLGAMLAKGTRVTGLDRARDMVAAARREHREAIDAGKLEVVEGDVAALPFEDESFERVLTVNTVYFWPDLAGALGEIARVLTPGGRLVVGIRDPQVMRKVSREIFTIRPPEEVRRAAQAAGFAEARLESPPDAKVHFVIATTAAPAPAAPRPTSPIA